MRTRMGSGIALLCAIVAGCDSSPTGGGNRGDVTPPAVSDYAPFANTISVAIGSAISVTFTEPLDPTTVNTSTFTVTGPSGAVAGTVTFAGLVATFTPTAPLTEFNTAYTATITTGVRDTAGNALAAAHTWQFSTERVSQLYWYRLSNLHLGDDYSLGTQNSAQNHCHMAETGNFSGQMWRFTSIANGRYKLSNMFRGTAMSLEGSDGTGPCLLTASGNFTGQNWTLVPVEGLPGRYRLQTQFLGNARSLDTMGGTNVPYMAETGGFTGQYWSLRRVAPIE